MAILDEVLTAVEISHRYGISTSTVRQAGRLNQLPCRRADNGNGKVVWLFTSEGAATLWLHGKRKPGRKPGRKLPITQPTKE